MLLITLILHYSWSYKPYFPFNAIRRILNCIFDMFAWFNMIFKPVKCLCQLDVYFPMVIFSNILKHFLCENTNLIKLVHLNLITWFLIELQILEPQGSIFRILRQTLITIVNSLINVIFSFFKLRCFHVNSSIWLVIANNIIKKISSLLNISESAFT